MAPVPKRRANKRRRKFNKGSLDSGDLRGITSKNLAESDMVIAGKCPKPPANLKGLALEKWKLIAPELYQKGFLKDLYIDALGIYCRAYHEYMHADIKLQETGGPVKIGARNGGEYRNMWLEVRNAEYKVMSQYAALFGLSPLDDSKIEPSKKSLTPPPVNNPFSVFKNESKNLS